MVLGREGKGKTDYYTYSLHVHQRFASTNLAKVRGLTKRFLNGTSQRNPTPKNCHNREKLEGRVKWDSSALAEPEGVFSLCNKGPSYLKLFVVIYTMFQTHYLPAVPERERVQG